MSLSQDAAALREQVRPQIEAEAAAEAEPFSGDEFEPTSGPEFLAADAPEPEPAQEYEPSSEVELADEIADRLNTQTIDVLLARFQALEAETLALRRITIEAIIAAREAVALSPYVDPFDYAEPELEAPRRRWWRLWR